MCRWNECKSYMTAEDEPNTGKIEFNDSVWHGMIWCACVLVASLSYNHCSPPSISLQLKSPCLEVNGRKKTYFINQELNVEMEKLLVGIHTIESDTAFNA